MQIEKPKPALPPGMILLAVIMSLLLLSLPFLAKKHSTPPMPAEPLVSAPEKEINDVLPAKESTSLVEEEVLPNVQEVHPDVEAAVSPLAKEEKAAVGIAPQLKEPNAVLTSFFGDVKVIADGSEQKAEKKRQILKDETIEVGASGEAVLELEELYVLRLKPNSKLTQLEPRQDQPFAGKQRMTYRFKLERGALLGTTKARGDKADQLEITAKDKVFNVNNSTFRVELSDADPWIGVLRGSVNSGVEKNSSQKPLVIHALEKVALTEAPGLEAPVQVTEQEWGLLKETYEMNMKTAAQEAQQIDLSKRAGDFFGYVFDHGTFYTENVGYTVRDFYEDKKSGEVYLEAEYDVFPANSFVGLYVLTRDLDARNYGGIRFDVRQKPDEGAPDRFYLEIKSKGQIIHRFEITGIKPEWGSRQIDFFSPVSLPITEVTLVFLNESSGKNKKGYIQMRNVQMIPLTEEQKAKRATAEKNPAPVTGVRALPQAPRSVNQAVITTPLKKAKAVIEDDAVMQPVPYRTDTSKKIADEVPKVVSFDDLSH